MTFKLVILNWRPSTLNRLMRGHIRTRIRLAQIDRNMVMGYALRDRIPVATGPRRVDLAITYSRRQKEADADAYWKSCLDSLVSARLLIDDHRKWVKMGEVEQERGKQTRTVISLTDLEPSGTSGNIAPSND